MTTKLLVQEEPAIYKVLVRAETSTSTAIGDLVVSDVEQTGPDGPDDFDYIDIGSVNNQTKRIEGPKRLPCSEAPSRARQRVRAGDVLVSMTRPNLNAVALVPNALDGATASTGFHVLRAGASAEPAWLFYAVQSTQFIGAMSALVQGALYPAVRPKDIRAFSLVVPVKAAQREVVAYLDEQLSRLDASVAALHRVQANLKRYRASVLKSACEGRLVPTEAELARQEGRDFETGAQLLQRILAERRIQRSGKGRQIEPLELEAVDLPEAPHGWAWCSLDQISSEMRNGFGGKPDGDNGTRILRISAVRALALDMTDVRYLSGDPDLYAQDLISANDLLFTRYNGSREFVGVCAVVPSLIAATAHPDKLIKVRCVADLAVPQFIALMSSCGSSRGHLESRMRTTAGQSGISGSDLKSLPIPLPPLAEQHRIVAEADRRLSLIRVAEAQVAANLARAQRLRQAILQAAFAGPTTAPLKT